MPILILLALLWFSIINLPFAMRSWRAFLALCAVYLAIGFGVRYGVATFSAAEVPAVLVMAGNIWLDLFVWAQPVPVIARAVVLTARSLGLGGGRLVALNVVGVLALPGLWLGLAAFERWERRPAPAECMAREIPLTLSGVDGSVGWDQSVNVHLGPDTRNDARYLFSPGHRRSVCRDTANGTERLNIKAISIDPGRRWPSRCEASDIQPWEQTLCAKAKDHESLPLPDDVVFFDPDGIRLGDFGIPEAATDADYPLAEDERQVTVANAEVGTVAAVCRSQPYSDGRIRCQMRRDIREGLSVSWDIYTEPTSVNDTLLQAETFARSVCASVFDLPECAAGPEPSP